MDKVTVKTKEIEINGLTLSIDYDCDDGEIMAICINDVDITGWLECDFIGRVYREFEKVE